MLLAATALLLQFWAVPNVALPAPSGDTRITTMAAAAGAAAAAAPAPEAAEPEAEISGTNTEPGSSVAYEPGRTARTVVSTAPASESSSVLPAPEPAIRFHSGEQEKRARWEQRQKKIWTGLTIAQSGAATLDAWSTRRVISSGVGHEVNPMLRPFAGNDSLYAAIQVGPLVFDYVGRRMINSKYGWARATWWIPQVLGTATSLVSGASNLALR